MRSVGNASITTALKNDNAVITTVEYKKGEEVKEEEEDEKEVKMIDISQSDLINKEEFYRSALKSHSLNEYKKQAMAKLTGSSGY